MNPGKYGDREQDGRYALNDMEAMCRCGHRLGAHAAHNRTRKRPCFSEDCACEHFRRARSAGK